VKEIAMIKLDKETIQGLADGVSEGGPRLYEGAGIAGTGLLLPLARLRTRTARRELARTRQREGSKSNAAKEQGALLSGLASRERDVAAQYAQRAGPQTTPGEREAALSGRITCDGTPLFDAEVLVLDAKLAQLRRTCTGRDGRYSLALPADQGVLFELRQDGKAKYRDQTPEAYPAGYRGQRDFEIGKADAVCDPSSSNDPSEWKLYVPDVVGLTRDSAAKSLSALGLKLGKVSEKPSAHPGLVVDQKPKAGEQVQAGIGVDLVVGSVNDKATEAIGDLKGQTLNHALKLMVERAIPLQSVTVSTGTSRTPVVQEARLAGSGNGAHLDVGVAGDKAAEIEVAAAVLVASPEGQSIGLDSATQAGRWLADAKIGSLNDLVEAAGEDDATLRKRFAIAAKGDVTGPRQALLAATSRITRA